LFNNSTVIGHSTRCSYD